MAVRAQAEYRIGLTADTSKFQEQVQRAFKSLQQLGQLQVGNAISSSLKDAAIAAQDLQQKLQTAMNPDGTLNLHNFQESLAASGKSLSSYQQTLAAIGPTGQQAFLNVASAISAAEVPIRRSTKLLDSLWTTMKNTVRWQLTTSALRTFTGAIQTAYGYVQDLDESLNSIRIVTQKSTEDMAAFAERANQAAKALSTTTTNYTDASLIYYQQGLDDAAVEERTNATIKLANVAGISAQEASEQLTAIWNNFDDGSQSLEHYVDVMVKLGAETASSSSEISEGLQKFAAVADTVGLSYEYAAAALATVTATTRESANVVGTAYRTLFARIQGLQQGETLDDGTDLNKYSQALASVGVQIKDTSGNLRDMDIILDDLGARWQTLAKDEQVALAETVAGVRQYTQLVALMDNWDFFQENLERARDSAGALQEQVDIYEESWEAARKRTKAAAEDIYASLFQSQDFIDLNDKLIVPLLDGIDSVVDAIGGFKGILAALGTVFTVAFHDKMAQGLRDLAYNFDVFTGKAQAADLRFKQMAADAAKRLITENPNRASSGAMMRVNVQSEEVQMQNEINQLAQKLTQEQVQQLTAQKNIVSQLGLAAANYKDVQTQARATTQELQKQLDLSKSTFKADFNNEPIELTDADRQQILARQPQLNLPKEPTKPAGASKRGYAMQQYNIDHKAWEDEVKKITAVWTQETAIWKKELADFDAKMAQSKIAVANFRQEYEAGNQLIANARSKLGTDLESGLKLDLTQITDAQGLLDNISKLSQAEGQLVTFGQQLNALSEEERNNGEVVEQMAERYKAITGLPVATDLQEIQNAVVQSTDKVQQASQVLETGLKNSLNQTGKEAQITSENLDRLKNSAFESGAATQREAEATRLATAEKKKYSVAIKEAIERHKDWADRVVDTAQALTSMAMAMQNSQNLAKMLFTKEEVDLGDRIVQILTNIGMLVPTIIKSFQADPIIGALTLIVTILGFAIEEFKQLHVTAEQAGEAITKAAQDYASAHQEVASLNQELKTTQERIDELNSKDTLTLVEQEELQNLERENILLERQIELARERDKVAAQEANSAFNQNFGIVAQDYERYNEELQRLERQREDSLDFIAGQGDDKTLAEYAQQVKERMIAQAEKQGNYLYARDLGNMADEEFEKIAKQQLTQTIEVIDNNIETLKKNNKETIERFQQMISDASSTWELQLADLTGDELMEQVNEITSSQAFQIFQEKVQEYLSDNEYFRLYIAPTIDYTALSEVKDKLYQLTTADIVGKDSQQILADLGITADKAEDIIRFMTQSGLTFETLIVRVSERVDMLRTKMAVLTGTNGNTMEKFINGLSAEDIELLLQIDIKDGESFYEFYEDYYKLKSDNVLDIRIEFTEALEAAKDAIASFIAGDFLTEEQVAAIQDKFGSMFDMSGFGSLSMYDQARTLNEMLMTMSDPVNAPFGQEIQKQAADYKERLDEVTESLKQAERIYNNGQGLSEAAKDYWEDTIDALSKEKVELNVDLDAAEKQLEELNDFELDPLKVEVDSTSVDALLGEMNAVGKAASMISEEYQVAAEDVADLMETMPQLFEDATVGPNGVVQLSKQVVQEVANDARAETEIRRNSLIEQLEARITESNIELDALKAVRDAAITGSQEATTQVLNDETQQRSNKEMSVRAIIQAKIQQALQERQQSQQTASNAIQDQNEVTNASAENASKTASNWNAGFQRIDSDALQAFTNVANYQSAVANNQTPTKGYMGAFTGIGTSSGTYQMSSNYANVGGEYGELQGYLKNFDVSDAAQTWEEWQNGRQYSSLQEQADDYEMYEAYVAGVSDKISQQLKTLGYDIDSSAIQSGGEKFLDTFIGTYNGDMKKFTTDLTEAISDTVYELGVDVSDLSKLKAGSYNYDTLANPSLLNPKSGSSKSSKEPKTEEPKEPDKEDYRELDKIEDRYHEINRTIEDVNSTLEDIEDETELAFGTKRLELFDKKLGELNKQADNYSKKLGEANAYLDYDRQQLQGYFSDIQFGPNDEILNYQDILDRLNAEQLAFTQQYNAFISMYNASSAEQQEAMKSQLEAYKEEEEALEKRQEKQREVLDQYEETVDVIQEIKDAWEENLREQEALELQKITYRLEVTVEIKNAKDAIRDFNKKFSDSFSDALYNGLFEQVWKRGDMSGENWGDWLTKEINTNGYQGLLKEQFEADKGLMNSYLEEYNGLMERLQKANQGTPINDIAEELLSLSGNITDLEDELLSTLDTMTTLLPDALDALSERFDKVVSEIEHNRKTLEQIDELEKLMGRNEKTDEGYALQQQNARARFETSLGLADAYRTQYRKAEDANRKAIEAYQALIDEYNGDMVAVEADVRYNEIKGEIDSTLEMMDEAEENMLQSATDAMEEAQEIFSNAVEKSRSDFESTMTNGAGFDWYQEQFDHYIEANDRYLDQVNEAYEVASWYNKLQADIDKTNNEAYKNQLRDLQKEIDLRREGGTLDEYDLEILEAKYKVLQAQMALEDAQNAKTDLRLVRDRQGNWNYQYTADQGEVLDREQELLDAQNDWYNIAKKQVEEVTRESIENWKEYAEEYEAIMNDMTLSDEQKRERLLAIQDYYGQRSLALEEKRGVALLDISEAGNANLEFAAQTFGKNIEGIASGFDSTWAHTLEDMSKDSTTFTSAVEAAMDGANDALNDYDSNVNKVEETVGLNLDSLREKTDAVREANENLFEYLDANQQTWWDWANRVQNLAADYRSLAQAIQDCLGQLSTMNGYTMDAVDSIESGQYSPPNVEELVPTQETLGQSYSYDYNTPGDMSSWYGGSGLGDYGGYGSGLGSGDTGAGSSGYGATTLTEGQIKAWAYSGGNTRASWYNVPSMVEKMAAAAGQENIDAIIAYAKTAEYAANVGNFGWSNILAAAGLPKYSSWQQLIRDYPKGFASGGYTGEFEGSRLAFLHEKELVLNKSDTQNILAAVSAIRTLGPEIFQGIESALDQRASAGLAMIGSRFSSAAGVPEAQPIEQTVHIEASFPNATDRNEIAEAFSNLVNDAAQWARRRI